VEIKTLYINRRRAYDDVHKIGLLGVNVDRSIFVHPDGIYIRVIIPDFLEQEVRAILLYGNEVDEIPPIEECSEYYGGDAIIAFRPQRKPQRVRVAE